MKRKVKESEIKVGDTVICKQNKQNKFSTKFEANPYTVVTVKGSKIVAKRGRHYMKRNSSFFKKILPRANSRPDDNDDEDYIPRNDDVNDRTTRRSTRARVQTRRFRDPVDSSLIH